MDLSVFCFKNAQNINNYYQIYYKMRRKALKKRGTSPLFLLLCGFIPVI